MIKRLIGLSILGLGILFGVYFSIYYGLIYSPTMLLILSVIVVTLFALGLFVLIMDNREKKLKKEKKIILEIIKKARVAEERRTYSGAFDRTKAKKNVLDDLKIKNNMPDTG